MCCSPIITGDLSGMRRRRLGALVLSAALAATLAACGNDPTTNWMGGLGDPVRGAALSAPRNLGNTSRWDGNPAGAARAVEQLEFLTDQFATNPRYAPEINPSVLQQLQAARTEMRAAVGIAPDSRPEPVIVAMRRTAEALDQGSRARAEAALSGPSFMVPPGVVLERLSTLPRLPRVANAAGAAANEIERLGNRRL
jgi:hypothetical protein